MDLDCVLPVVDHQRAEGSGMSAYIAITANRKKR